MIGRFTTEEGDFYADENGEMCLYQDYLALESKLSHLEERAITQEKLLALLKQANDDRAAALLRLARVVEHCQCFPTCDTDVGLDTAVSSPKADQWTPEQMDKWKDATPYTDDELRRGGKALERKPE